MSKSPNSDRWINVALAMLAFATIVNSVRVTIGATWLPAVIISNAAALLACGSIFMAQRAKRRGGDR